MLHGADQANCMEKYRRQTISNGEKKGYPKEEPYARRESGQEVIRECPTTSRGSSGTKTCEEANSPHPANEPSPRHYDGDLLHLFHQSWLDVGSAEGFRKEGLKYRPDEGIRHQFPKEAWTASPNA